MDRWQLLSCSKFDDLPDVGERPSLGRRYFKAHIRGINDHIDHTAVGHIDSDGTVAGHLDVSVPMHHEGWDIAELNALALAISAGCFNANQTTRRFQGHLGEWLLHRNHSSLK